MLARRSDTFVLRGRALKTADALREKKEPLKIAFFWLTAFYFIYCARPQDYIFVLDYLSAAKAASVLAVLSLLLSAGKTPRGLKDLPKEAFYLLFLIVLLFASALLSPVWRGGAFFNTLDFAKVYVAWILTFLLVTTLDRLRRIIFVQAASVAVISLLAIVKGHSVPRLLGVIGGFYSNPNDMAFAIVLSLPFCLAFLLSAKSILRKAAWCFAIATMTVALFMTASRAGFIQLAIAGGVSLWYFGVKGKRLFLIVAVFFIGALLLAVTGKPLVKRFAAISGEDLNSSLEGNAYGSYVERRLLMAKAVDAIVHYPVFGVGAGNFIVYSGMWKNVHASYLQIAAEGGLPVFFLYLMFFARGFANLRYLGRLKTLDKELDIFLAASRGSLVGFVVGACFAPEAYQFFPYLAVCYTSVLVAMVTEEKRAEEAAPARVALPVRGFANTYMYPGRSRAFKPAG